MRTMRDAVIDGVTVWPGLKKDLALGMSVSKELLFKVLGGRRGVTRSFADRMANLYEKAARDLTEAAADIRSAMAADRQAAEQKQSKIEAERERWSIT